MIDCRRWLFVLIVVCGGLSPAASAADVQIGYSEPLENLSFARGGAEFQKPGPRLEQRMRFDAFSRRFEIELTPNAALIEAIERQALGNELDVFRGSLPGIERSWARIVIADGVPQGLVFDGTEIFAIERADDGQAKMFRLSDLYIEPGTMTCAASHSASTGAELLKLVTNEVSATVQRAQGAQSEIDVAVIADFEFANVPLRDAEAEMITRMNNVDGIFSSQLGVQINIGRIDVFSDPDDPFTNETNASDLLDEVADFRAGSAAQRANGLTHLFTGRNLDGSTVGVAFGGALCSGRFGAGLTQGTNGVTTDSLVAAHELGHNFGAPHDGTSDGPCVDTPQNFLMAPRLNGSDTFSSCSIQQMEDDVARASCITALASADVAVAAPSQPGSILLGNSTSVSFSVTSAGTEAVDGVSLAATLPSNLSLDSATTSVGTCTSGAGTVDCSIGSLAAGSGASVTLAVTAADVGTGDIVATTSTTSADGNATNDQASARVTVDPAVDLIASAETPGSVTVNQQVTLRPQVENRASIAATNLSVSVTPTAGLRIDAASWSAGNCSIVSGAAECTAASLAANSTATLDVRVTALTEGQQSYSVSASATEADRNGANNDSSVNFTVSQAAAPPDSGDSGGGGSMTLGLLVLLALLALLGTGRSRVKPVPIADSRRPTRRGYPPSG